MSLDQIASSYHNWQEFFDVYGEMSWEQFNAMSFDERMALLEDAFL